ncbi:MAG TPA: hypothetical protein VMW52_08075 [Phycisphaerae bacterium]|nr:hypothetical protein [Phycisphaerae bacterium]
MNANHPQKTDVEAIRKYAERAEAEIAAAREARQRLEKGNPLICAACGKQLPTDDPVREALYDGLQRFGRIHGAVKCGKCKAADREARREQQRRASEAQAEAVRQARAKAWEGILADLSGVLHSTCGVPPRYSEARLDRCPDIPAAILEDLTTWTEAPASVLYLFSAKPGSGKTYSAVAVMAALIRDGQYHPRECRFISEKGILTLGGQSRRELIARLAGHRLLIYDDLFASASWDSDKSTVSDLLADRHASQAVTIVTSNLDLDRVAHTDPRLASRLAEGVTALDFPNVDLRAVGSLRTTRTEA